MKKKVFLISIVIGILVIIFLVNFVINNKKNDNTFRVVKDRNEYYEVAYGINKFYMFCKNLYNENDINYNIDVDIDEGEQNGILEEIFDLLDSEYITFSNINTNQLKEKLNFVENTSTIHIDSIYRICKQDKVSLYYIKSTLFSKNETTSKNIELILKKSDLNNTFSIYLSDYIEHNGYNNLVEGNRTKINLKSIGKNSSNIFEKNSISDYEHAVNLFNDFKNNCIYNREYAYKMLDNQNINSKFKDFETFNEYVKSNIKEMVLMQLNEFDVKVSNGITEYICKDNNNKSYVFKETSPMVYKVIIE